MRSGCLLVARILIRGQSARTRLAKLASGGRLDDVLAVVEDQHLVPFGKGGGQPVKRARAWLGRPARDDGLADADRFEHRVRDLGRIGHRRQFHEPCGGVQAPASLGRQPGLAHSPGAGQRDQARGRQVLPYAGHVTVAADKARQGVGHPAGSGAGARYHGSFGRNKGKITGAGLCLGYGGQPLLAPQDPQVDLFQLVRGVHAELVGEQRAGLVVDGERLRLAAGRVERAHEKGAGAFGQRIGGHQCAQLADQAGARAEGQVRLDPIRQGGGAQFGQPRRGGVRDVVAGRVGQRLAAPPVQRGAQGVGGRRRVAVGQRAAAPGGEGLEFDRIDRLGPNRETIARRVRFDHVVKAGLAQFGASLETSVCSALPGLPGGRSGQIWSASEAAGTTRPASRASKVSRTRS